MLSNGSYLHFESCFNDVRPCYCEFKLDSDLIIICVVGKYTWLQNACVSEFPNMLPCSL